MLGRGSVWGAAAVHAPARGNEERHFSIFRSFAFFAILGPAVGYLVVVLQAGHLAELSNPTLWFGALLAYSVGEPPAFLAGLLFYFFRKGLLRVSFVRSESLLIGAIVGTLAGGLAMLLCMLLRGYAPPMNWPPGLPKLVLLGSVAGGVVGFVASFKLSTVLKQVQFDLQA